MSNHISLFNFDTLTLMTTTVFEVMAWMSNYISLFYLDVIIPPYPNLDAGLVDLKHKENHHWS